MAKRAKLLLGAAVLAAMSAGFAAPAFAAQEQTVESAQSTPPPVRCFYRGGHRYCYQPPAGPVYRDPPGRPDPRIPPPPPPSMPPPSPPPPPMHSPYCPGCNGHTSDVPAGV